MHGRSTSESLARNESGQSSVEAAVSLLIAITTCFWLFELSMLVYTYSVLNEAAQEGVRYAVMHGVDSTNCSGPTAGCTDASGANVAAVVKNLSALSFHNTSAMQISVSYPETGGAHAGSLVSVSINYTFVPYIKLPSTSNSLFVQAQGRIIY